MTINFEICVASEWPVLVFVQFFQQYNFIELQLR